MRSFKELSRNLLFSESLLHNNYWKISLNVDNFRNFLMEFFRIQHIFEKTSRRYLQINTEKSFSLKNKKRQILKTQQPLKNCVAKLILKIEPNTRNNTMIERVCQIYFARIKQKILKQLEVKKEKSKSVFMHLDEFNREKQSERSEEGCLLFPSLPFNLSMHNLLLNIIIRTWITASWSHVYYILILILCLCCIIGEILAFITYKL